MSYLDSLPEFNNKAILVQSTLGYQMAMAYLGYRDVGLENLESGSYLLGDFEDNNGPFNNVQLASPNESLFDSLSDEITWYNQLLGVANDTNQSEDTRLKCLTELVDQARLNEVPLLPYNPVITPQTNIPPSALVIHNETTGVDGVGFLHIGPVELALIYSARQSFDSFAQITGVYTDNASLVGGFATKEGIITPSGNAAQFWNGNKTFAAVAFNQLTGVPTTLAGYGISASDNLFDNKYLQLGSQLQTLNTTSGTPLTTTTTVIEGFGRLQNQVSARELSLGNPAVNGYVLSSTTAGVRSWIPAPTGTAVTGISLTGTNGITGAVVITAGNAVITAGTNITGMLKGNGTAISAATEMTDYIGITGAANGDTILFTGGVATWAPGLSNPMTLLGDLIIGGASGATTRLAGNTTTTRKFLMSVGASGAALAQTYESLLASDIPDIAISQVTNLQATLDGYLPDALANGMLFIGNVSDVAVNAIVTGDLTATYVNNSGTNEAEFTIANEAVTYAKIQNVTSQTLLGRFASTDGVVQQLTLNGSDFTINSSTGEIGLVTPNSPILTTKGDILTHTGAAQARLGIGANATFFMADTAATTGNKWVAMSGDATIATSGALTIAAGAVTLAKMANMATNSFIGRISASTGVPEILTATQATSLLNLFSSSAKGLAPVVTGAAIGDATYFLNATGTWTVPAGGGGGGSGTVTSVSVVSANGFAGTVATATTTPAITLTTSITGLLKGSGGALVAATAGTDYLTSVGLTMPSAFTVTTSPLTANGTLAVTGAGTVSQYIRGDGTLANFPTSGGGGASLSYYLNGSVASSVVGYEQMNRVPVIGAGTNYTLNNTTGYQLMAQFVTDANDPYLLNIPAGAWDIGFYFSSSNNSGNPAFYVELLKYDGTTFTTIANNSANPEIISNGTAVDLYNTSIAVSSTSLTITDRLVIRVYVDTAGSRTITFHTEDNNLAQIITTFTTGLTALNGLTAQVQFLGAVGTTGTAPAWTSTTATHTLNIPLASAASVTAGLISKTEYDTFNSKLANVLTTTGDIIYSSSGTTAARLGIGTTGQVLSVVGGIPAWSSAGSGDVTGPASSVDGNFAVFDSTTGKIIKESAGASLSAAGAAVFNTSLALGVSGPAGTTGQLIFRNSANAFTTTIQASTSASANASYTWPQAQAASAGLLLANDGSGNLSWTAAGTGNVTLAGTNPFTGANSFASTTTFNGSVSVNGIAGGSLNISSATDNTLTTLVSTATTINKTITFPNASGIVALSNVGQTFSGTQIFRGSVNIDRFNGGTLNINSATSSSVTTFVSTALTTDKTVTFQNFSGIVALTDTTQTFSGAQTFSNSVYINRNGGGSFKIGNPASFIGTLLTSLATGADKTVTFPDATGTVPLLSFAQTFSALQTFSAGLTVSAGTTTISGAATITGGATFTTTVSTFNSGILRIGNATNTQFYTIVGSAIAAARQLTLPLITATDTFAVLGLAQTFSTAQTFGAGITISAGFNIAFGTTGAGGQIGTATTQLIGFHGTAGTIQRASAAQAAVATTAATLVTPYGYTTAAQADGIVTLLNEIRTVLVNKGLMKGSA